MLTVLLDRHADADFTVTQMFWCRDSATQIAMLDRIAGTTSQAAAFGGSLHTLRQMEQQLADFASLGNEEERNEVQHMIQEVT